jgi:flavodoxin
MLDLFQTLPDVDEQKLHAKYKVLRDHLALSGELEVLKDWISGFVDRDNKIVKEFQTSFHSAFWEIFLHAFLKEAALQVDYSKNRPDFIVTSPTRIFVEAVVSEIKKEGRKEETRDLYDLLETIEPIDKSAQFDEMIDEAITRHSNSIRQKSAKYLNEYLPLQWVDQSAPFVVALGSYDQLHYGREFTHSMFALLYGMRYARECNGYKKIEKITKPGTTSPIPVGIFLNEDFSHISAIIFSCTVTLGKLTSMAISRGGYTGQNGVFTVRHDMDWPHFKGQIVTPEEPEYLSDGVFVFFNPNAKNPLPTDFFGKTNAISIFELEGGIAMFGENLPIVQRFNLFRNIVHNEIFCKSIILDFNS